MTPIEKTLHELLHDYLKTLEGDEPSNLYGLVLSAIEPALLKFTLNLCQHNQTVAARLLGISRITLRKKMTQYGLL